MKPNSVANRARLLAVVVFVASGTVVTQELVSTSASAIERSEQADATLAALTQTVSTVQGSLGRARDEEFRAIVRDFDATFDRILLAPSVGLDLGVIDLERRAFVHAFGASTPESSPYLASGARAIDLQARKLIGAILGQRELLEVARSRAVLNAQIMAALASGGMLLLIAYLVWRPIIAVRAGGKHPRLITPLFVQ